jgi:hypothetical protein
VIHASFLPELKSVTPKRERFYGKKQLMKIRVDFEIGPDKEIKGGNDRVVIFGSETGGKFELTDAHPAIKPSTFAEAVASSKISMMFEVESLSDIIERAKSMGYEPAVGVRHYYYGTLEVVFKDPDGMVIVFIEPYTQGVAKKLGASEEFGVAPRA